MDEMPKDDVGQSPFQSAAGFVRCLMFGEFAAVEVLSGPGSAGLADRYRVDCRVELAVAQAAQAVPVLVAAGGIQGRGPVVAGVVVARREPADVTAPAALQDRDGSLGRSSRSVTPGRRVTLSPVWVKPIRLEKRLPRAWR